MKALLPILILISFSSYAQIVVSPTSNTTTLIDQLLGDAIILSGSPTKYCNSNGTGTFTDGHTTSCPLDSGIILSTGYASFLNRTATFTASAGLNYGMNDPDLYSLNFQSNTDICYLEFDFVPTYDSIAFDYVFGSEEYLEWVGSPFNDVFGFFITGPNPAGGNYNKHNLAVVPSSSDIVSINSINNTTNSSYYINNYPTGAVPGIDDPNFTPDGFTTIMQVGMSVVPAATYTIKMAVADVSDPLWDSYVILHNKSFRSISNTPLAVDLVQFEGVYTSSGIELFWQTAQEEDNRLFEMEHSLDGQQFEVIASLSGAVNSQHIQAYSFTDAAYASGWNYYRLKWIDGHSNTSFSKVIAVLAPIQSSDVRLYPSVVTDGRLHVQAENPAFQQAQLMVYDIKGRLLKSLSLDGQNTQLDVSGLKEGAYTVIFNYAQNSIVRRFVVVK